MSGNIQFQLDEFYRGNHMTTFTDTATMVTRVSPEHHQKKERSGSGTTEDQDSIRRLLALYGTSASIHGMSQIGGPPLYGFRRWLWLLLVVAMGVGLSVTLYKQVKRLSSFPIKTTVKPEFEEEVQFPAVTVCNLNQFHRERLPNDPGLHHLIRVISEWTYLTGDDPNITDAMTTRRAAAVTPPSVSASSEIPSPSFPSSTIRGEELRQIVWDSAHRLSQFFYKCTWRSRLVPCQDIFEARMTDLGVCFTFNGNLSREIRTSSMAGPWMGLRLVLFLDQDHHYFSRTMQAGVKVVLHEPGHRPMPDLAGLLLRPGVSANVAFSKIVDTGLPPPYRAFGHTHCLDTKAADFNRTLYRYNFYSQPACIRDCLLAVAEDACGCASPFEPETKRDIPVCSVDQMLSCYVSATANFTQEDLHRCECRPACDRVRYEITTSYADFASDFMEQQVSSGIGRGRKEFLRNVVDVRVFLDTLMVVHVRQEPEMTLTDVLGDLGGHLGLFLGASLLSVTELTEMLVLLVLRVMGCIPGRAGPERNEAERGEESRRRHAYEHQDREGERQESL